MNGERSDLVSPGGGCICPNCGFRSGGFSPVPCYTRRCPQCGSPMADR